MAARDKFDIRRPSPPSGLHLNRRLILLAGMALVGIVAVVMFGPPLTPQRVRPKPTPQANFSRPGKDAKALGALPHSYQGMTMAQPVAPTIVQAPLADASKDEELARLRHQVQALQAAIDAIPKTPPALMVKPEDPDVKQRREARRNAEEAARKLVVWRAPEDDAKAPKITGVKTPASRYAISPGWIIPCVLEMQISNEITGPFRARVREDVYDSATGQHVVIPAGSILVGQPRGSNIFGDARIGVSFSTLTFPNGQYVELKQISGLDGTGKPGFSDLVDRKWGQLFGSILLTGVLRGGTGIAGGYSGDTAERIVGSVGTETASQGTRQVRQVLRTEPTLTIREGYLCHAFFDSELALAQPPQ